MTTITTPDILSDILSRSPVWSAQITSLPAFPLSRSMPSQNGEDTSNTTPMDFSVHAHLLPIVRELGRVETPDYDLQQHDSSRYLPKGQRIANRHVVEEWIGDHSVSQLYRVRHATISTFTYALKMLQPAYAETPKVLEQFRNEVSALARLQNPLLPQVIDMGVLEDGRPYQCFEIVPGVELDTLVNARGAQPEPVVWHIAADLLSILDEIHKHGLRHGSIQPRIIRLWKDPGTDEIHPRILDFTTIHAIDGPADGVPLQSSVSEYRALLNPRYSAPECYSTPELPACDIYAISTVIAELLDGTPLFDSDSDRDDPQAALGPNARASLLAPVLARGLHPDRGQRYANGAEMLRDFVRVVLEAEPSFVYQLSGEVLERYGSGAGKPQQEMSTVSGAVLIPPIFTPHVKKKPIDPVTTPVEQTPPMDDANSTGTARMRYVPARDNNHGAQEVQSSARADRPRRINYRVSLFIRIGLILTFMLVALLILFLGLPS